jgi:hypothetical protein
MEGITLCVGLVTAALVLLIPLRYGLIVYLATLLCYPSYLRIIAFGCTVSAGRIVIAALLIRCLLDEKLRRRFQWTKLDTLIIVADVVYVLALSFAPAVSFLDSIKYRSGLMLDTTFAYFSARLIINNRAVLVNFVKAAAVILVVMAFLGVFEAVTTVSPYKGLMAHRFYAERSLGASKLSSQEVAMGHGQEERYGFFRAQGSHDHPIIFGASFAIFLPLVWKLLYHTRWIRLRAPVCGAIVVGGASSMSSTPFSGLLVALIGLIFERFEQWGKRLLIIAVLSCIFLEFYTNRPHFYYVLLSRLSIDAGTGYDRGRLIDAALKHLPEYWLTGYGFNDPGWGPEVGGTDYTDVCVNYVYLAVMYGVFGLLAYLAIVFDLLFSLWRKYRRSVEILDRNICWALIISIAVILTIDLGVAPFGALPSLNSIIFGIGGSVISLGFNSRYAAEVPRTLLIANHI